MNRNKLNAAIELIDQANREDPNLEKWQDQVYPKELLYSQRMSEWLEKMKPDADEAHQLAARAQHLTRWKVPRESYPKTREGYLQWRIYLYDFQADEAGKILNQVGFDDETISRVKKMVGKKGQSDEVQLIEDVACLVFMEYYLPEFAGTQSEDKLIDIVRKTWRKMSEAGQRHALGLNLSDDLMDVVVKAIG